MMDEYSDCLPQNPPGFKFAQLLKGWDPGTLPSDDQLATLDRTTTPTDQFKVQAHAAEGYGLWALGNAGFLWNAFIRYEGC